MDKYINALEKVYAPRDRRNTPGSPLAPKELHQYRSIVGQLAWLARQVMPQLSFHVSDLQQKTKSVTVHELIHANRVLDWAQQWVNRDKTKLRFLPLKGDVNVNLVYTEQQDSRYHKQQVICCKNN
jgi:hypothetical protein